jgi:hypothetical protein
VEAYKEEVFTDMKQRRGLFFLPWIILVLYGCQTKWHQQFPVAEIVYQTGPYSEKLLGFANSDGLNPEILQVGGFLRKPVWSSDGSLIYGLANSVPAYTFGNPAYWEQSGKFKECKKWGNFGWIEEGGNKENNKEVFISNARTILLVDLGTCKQIKVIEDYSNRSDFYVNDVPGISFLPDRQELLYSLEIWNKTLTEIRYSIFSFNLKSGKTLEIAEGINPRWSPDGSQIAFVRADGIYIMDPDTLISKVILKQSLADPSGHFGEIDPLPRWSPDGEWIIYNRCEESNCEIFNIYKINVNDGQERLVVKDGHFPFWKQ